MSALEVQPSRAVRVRVAFGFYRKGQIIDAMPAAQRRGFVEKIDGGEPRRRRRSQAPT